MDLHFLFSSPGQVEKLSLCSLSGLLEHFGACFLLSRELKFRYHPWKKEDKLILIITSCYPI